MIPEILQHNKKECQWYIDRMQNIIERENSKWFTTNHNEIATCKNSIGDFRTLINETENFSIGLTHLSFTIADLDNIARHVSRNRKQLGSYSNGGVSSYSSMGDFKEFYFKKLEKTEALVYMMITYNNTITQFYLKKSNSFYRELNLKKISYIEDLIKSQQTYLSPSSSFTSTTRNIGSGIAHEKMVLRNDTNRSIYISTYYDKHYKNKKDSFFLPANTTKEFNEGRMFLNIIYVNVSTQPVNPVDGGVSTLKAGYKYKIALSHNGKKLILLGD